MSRMNSRVRKSLRRVKRRDSLVQNVNRRGRRRTGADGVDERDPSQLREAEYCGREEGVQDVFKVEGS